MSAMTEHIDIDALVAAALDVRPVRRDWSEGYGESWDFIEVPVCDLCGEYARWDADEHEWRCPEHEAGELWPGASPMMNFAYPLPDLGVAADVYDAADRIHDLPLCVVSRDGGYELALTGGGMDLSWEICEAFMRLGFLPPFHFCELPGMAGRGQSPRDRAIIAACRRAVSEHSRRIAAEASWRLQRLDYIEQGD